MITVTRVGTETLVIHAMPMRGQYEPYLRGQEDDDG